MNPEVVRRLLKQKPFKRFVLCLATDYEYEVDNVEHWRLIADNVIARSAEGMTDLINLKLVDRIRIEDGFTLEALDRLMK